MVLKKYENLRLRDSFSLSYRYPMACRELGLILRLAYSRFPKSLQSLLLEDTIAAFRILPQMQTEGAVSAANFLSQSAEAALPKQKRGLSATEFKNAKVAYKRRAKRPTPEQEDRDFVQIPQDVLVHVFSFLDMQSLISAGMVCWSWNTAADDKYLWKYHYNTYFGDSDSIMKLEELQGHNNAQDRQQTASNGVCDDVNYEWKDGFRRAYLGLPSWRYKYNRGYCGHCNSIVWLDNLRCPNKHSRQESRNQQLMPVSPNQIVGYIIDDDTSWMIYASGGDSDSESDEESALKFWTPIY